MRKLQHEAGKDKRALGAIGLPVSEDLTSILAWEEVGDEGKPKDYLGNFAQQWTQLGGMGPRLYLDWARQTRLPHVGIHTSVAYLRNASGQDAPTLAGASKLPPRDTLREASLPRI